MKWNFGKSITGFLILGFFLSVHTAYAGTLENVVAGIIDLRTSLQKVFLDAPKTDFCTQYHLNVTGGTWRNDGLRSSIGKIFCEGKIPNESVLPKLNTSFVPTQSVTATQNVKKTSTALSLPTNLSLSQHEKETVIPVVNAKSEGTPLVGEQILYWTNIERNKVGISGLGGDTLLNQIALTRVNDMFARAYFEHTTPDGQTVSQIAQKSGYGYITIGENIALGNFTSSRDLVESWMNSPGHRANIVSGKYTEIGIAAKEGMFDGKHVWIAAQIFGKPISLCTEPSSVQKKQIVDQNAYLMSLAQKIAQNQSLSGSMSADAIAAHNELVNTYNGLVAKLKEVTALYNKQVEAFNNCVKLQ